MSDIAIYDLYSGPGGVGLALARIIDEYWDDVDVRHVGVDIDDFGEEYPGDFVQADASRPPLEPGPALLWLSPPCLRWTPMVQVAASRYDWDEGEVDRRYPDFDDLRVREVIDELDPDDYVIENVPRCPRLEDPTRLDGVAFDMEIRMRRHFETSFAAPSHTSTGSAGLKFSQGESGYNTPQRAEAKNVPKGWPESSINAAIPQQYVQYLLHYCPSVPDVPLPDGVDRQSLLTEVAVT